MRLRSPAPRALAAACLLGALVAGCAGRPAPIGAGGHAFRVTDDERALWDRAAGEEQALLQRSRTFDDPALRDYLKGLVRRLLPAQANVPGAPALDVVVLRDPTLAAFAMPDGRLFVHTGLLSRVQNEAQLAIVLARELAHVTHRDALEYVRDARNRKLIDELVPGLAANVGLAAELSSRPGTSPATGVAVLSPTANTLLALDLKLTATAAVSGYAQAQEKDADTAALAAFIDAGYDPTQATRVFEVLQAGLGPMEMFFYGTPARLKERIDNLLWLVVNRYKQTAEDLERVDDTPAFGARMRAVARENALLDIHAGRFDLAQRQLDRVLRATPDDPVAHLYYGDLYRLGAQRARTPAERAPLEQRALASYERAAALDPTFAEPFRQLGLLYYSRKQTARARASFQMYLALAPSAPDAARVREYLSELDR